MSPRHAPAARALRTWESFAPHYDRNMRRLEKAVLRDGRAWACGEISGDVLEVAVGTGLNLPHYPRRARVTGLDFSPAMLAQASQRAAELDRPVRLVRGDAGNLPFPDRSFDAAAVTLSLCAVPDVDAALSEIARVLRPGGELRLLDHVGSSWPPIWLLQRLVDLFTVPIAGEHYTRRPLPLLRRGGWEILEASRHTFGMIERVRARRPR